MISKDLVESCLGILQIPPLLIHFFVLNNFEMHQWFYTQSWWLLWFHVDFNCLNTIVICFVVYVPR